VNFDDSLDRYYWEGHQTLNDFPSWAFELYLREIAHVRPGAFFCL
jgi:hypothetical protein